LPSGTVCCVVAPPSSDLSARVLPWGIKAADKTSPAEGRCCRVRGEAAATCRGEEVRDVWVIGATCTPSVDRHDVDVGAEFVRVRCATHVPSRTVPAQLR
jgi:hypothetical protein